VKRAALGLFIAGSVAVLTGAACAPAVDPGRIAAIQVVGAESAVRGCRALGTLEGIDSDRFVPGGPRYEVAMLDLRKKAVTSGGNYLVTESVQSPSAGDYNPIFVIRAKLFSCEANHAENARITEPTGPLMPAAPAPRPPEPDRPVTPVTPAATAAAPICEPDCSPGYTCLRGTCVSACNPLCGGGERCGADRICHAVAPLPR
jgi:hypothetical protein